MQPFGFSGVQSANPFTTVGEQRKEHDMRRQRCATSGVWFACVVAAVMGAALAEEIGPGEYQGYFTTDRWGRAVFHTGPYHLFVSDAAAAQLKGLTGTPLKLDVTDVDQPQNPGGACIERVGKVTKLPAPPLVLKATAKEQKVEAGRGVALELVVSNQSDRPLEVSPEQLALVLVTDSPFPNSAIGYEDPHDRAFWYYRYAYRDAARGEGKAPVLQIACREVIPPWEPDVYARDGKGVRVGPEKPTHQDPGTYRPVILAPRGSFSFEYTVGTELPPGEYEVFLCNRGGNLSDVPGAVSERVAFDVVAERDARAALTRPSVRGLVDTNDRKR